MRSAQVLAAIIVLTSAANAEDDGTDLLAQAMAREEAANQALQSSRAEARMPNTPVFNSKPNASFCGFANNGSKPFGFTVKSVYTHGSPGLSENPLPNNEADDQCFGGYRWYNHDLVDYDIVTGTPQIGIHHAYVPAVRLSRPSASDRSYLEVHTYGCKSHCTVKYPNHIAMVGNLAMHIFSSYLPRIRDHYTLGLGKANATCPEQSWFRSKAPEAAKSVNKDVSGGVLVSRGGGALVIGVLMAAFV